MTTIPLARPFRTSRPVRYARFTGSPGGETFTPSSRIAEDTEREEIRRRRCRILVVDDEDGFREVLCRKLERIYQATVLEAAGPHDALRIVQRHPHPELILLDISMPEMDGIEVCRKMRADGVTSAIVLMSAQASAENHSQAETLGVQLLAKPLREDALRQILLECGGDLS